LDLRFDRHRAHRLRCLARDAPRPESAGTATRFGACVAGLGDTNGDDRADLIVGAPAYASNRGRAIVFRGSATSLFDPSPAARLTRSETTPSWFGYETTGRE
jgi:hypothetical protein